VKDEILPIINVRRAGDGGRPSEDDHATAPRFAEASAGVATRVFVPLMPAGLGDVGVRVNEDRAEGGIIVRLAVEEKQAGLRGDENFYLVRDLKPSTAFKVLLRYKNLDVSFQFPLVGFGQPVEEREVVDNR